MGRPALHDGRAATVAARRGGDTSAPWLEVPQTLTEKPCDRPAQLIEEAGEEAADEIPLLTEPADRVPPVIVDQPGLQAAITSLAAGTGPVAVDAERAHGFRYSTRAYLIQLRRQGSGTHLIDPVAFAHDPDPADLSALGDSLAEAEWIIHAASQDLHCLAEVQLVPGQLFDTELAGRLLGYPRVALGTLIEKCFGVRLLKEHSAADWSTRPLPQDWLTYAALDVELLIELRATMAEQLEAAGKLDWARQEFAALAAGATTAAPVRVDPWRRTSGIQKLRTPAQLAIVRELWETRDAIARRLDKAPGRLLSDAGIAQLASVPVANQTALRQIPAFSRRAARRYQADWLQALDRARRLPRSSHPPLRMPSDDPPPPRSWPSRNPVAAARLRRIRDVATASAERLGIPAENLLTPSFLRKLAWAPPVPITEAAVDAFLTELGARQWQRDLLVNDLTRLLADPQPDNG